MNLRSGVRLGPYEIVAPIGAGGMGEVYKATDTRLARTVAIKILPAEFSSDAKLKIRFEREAKTVSSLNHPHICSLYDVGENYLVMEYCEGQTLAQRLERGALTLDQVLEYGVQIAEALDRAHRSGIIHRDLKPSNIMITKSGVKLLDFGLAKEHGAAVVTDGSRTTTLNRPLTEEGTLVGTVQYMAPETIAHGVADARSDIFALGLVLYEMLTGKPAFKEDSRAKLIAAILEREPPPLPETPNPQVAHILTRCLVKDPARRWQDAADVAGELSWVQKAPLIRPSAGGWRMWLGIAAVAATGLIAIISSQTDIERVQPTWFSVRVAEPPLVLRDGRLTFAISRDGRAIVYSAGEPPRLFLRRLDSGEATALEGTENAGHPFFSPDGLWVGFFSGAGLKKVSIGGGAPQAICEEPGGFQSARWEENGQIYFRRNRTLHSVPASGGTSVELLPPSSKMYYSNPSLLPGGRKLLLDLHAWPEKNDITNRTIAVLDLETKELVPIYTGGSQPRYSSPGHLLFLKTSLPNERRGTIFSVPFDLETLRVNGEPVPRIRDVAAYPINGTGYWESAPVGTIVYVPADPAFIERELVWITHDGIATPASGRITYFANIDLAPDATRVAFDDLSSIWVLDLERDLLLRLVAGGRYSQGPVWSPDGQTIAFESWQSGKGGVFVIPSDGTGTARRLVTETATARVSSWAPDGSFVAYGKQPQGAGETWDIWAVDPRTEKAKPLLAAPGPQDTPAISPDGRWMAFVSITGATFDVHVQNLATGGRKTVIANVNCGSGPSCTGPPKWSSDGRQIYLLANKALIAVGVTRDEKGLRFGPPRVLYRGNLQSFDVAPDGKRFIASRWKQEARWDHINIVSGWWGNN